MRGKNEHQSGSACCSCSLPCTDFLGLLSHVRTQRLHATSLFPKTACEADWTPLGPAQRERTPAPRRRLCRFKERSAAAFQAIMRNLRSGGGSSGEPWCPDLQLPSPSTNAPPRAGSHSTHYGGYHRRCLFLLYIKFNIGFWAGPPPNCSVARGNICYLVIPRV